MEPSTDLNERLSSLIEEITTCGSKILDEVQVKEVKKICKTADSYLRQAFTLLYHQLKQPHAEIRLAAFQLCDELFHRSHAFRELLLSEFQDVMDLVVGLEPESKLPPPKATANNLKVTALRAVDQWHKKFGEGYKKLSIGYTYLKNCKNIDFQNIQARTQAEAAQNTERNARLAALKSVKLDKLKEEVDQYEPDFIDCVSQMEAGIALLIPKLEMFDENCDVDVDDAGSDDLRAHGLTGASLSIAVDIRPEQHRVTRSSDNEAVIDFLKDQHLLLSTKLMPLVSKWNSLSTKLNAPGDFVKKILDLKQGAERVDLKYRDLQLPVNNEIGWDSDDDSDFELVGDKEGYEESAIEPSFIQASRAAFDQPGTSGYSRPQETKDLNSRVWSCRAPLPSGRLCPRQDKHKCPLHGVIVPRDEAGTPRDPNSVPSKKNEVPDWQDPVLLAEIKAATGVDLTMPVKGQRAKKVKYPKLTDLKAQQNTSRARLENKIFKKGRKASKKPTK